SDRVLIDLADHAPRGGEVRDNRLDVGPFRCPPIRLSDEGFDVEALAGAITRPGIGDELEVALSRAADPVERLHAVLADQLGQGRARDPGGERFGQTSIGYLEPAQSLLRGQTGRLDLLTDRVFAFHGGEAESSPFHVDPAG